jgi:hypothetical protein
MELTSQDAAVPSGHELTFNETLKIVSEDIFIQIVIPLWVPGFTKRMRKVRTAFLEIRVCIRLFVISYSNSTTWAFFPLRRT